ncbi:MULTISPECIES: hypothetical protein [unclassified Myroides]|uniref:hypothetical protein n=1 Tax=unclassified Myroides TaxID=2642485 RepID=UPI003D2F5FC4
MFLFTVQLQAQEKVKRDVVATSAMTAKDSAKVKTFYSNWIGTKRKRTVVQEEYISCNFSYVEEMRARSRGDVALGDYQLEELRRRIARSHNVVSSAVFIIRVGKGDKSNEYEACVGGILFSFTPRQGYIMGSIKEI